MQLLRSDSHPRMRSLPDPTTDRWTSHLSFSVSGLAGDIPSTPTLETSCAGCAAQAVQSVVWVNISELASTNFSQVGGQQELTDLLGGLLLNSSGNVTGSLRPVTSELPTLGLSRQVMGALANVALPNDGGYPAPPANVQAPPKEEQWWQVPGTVLWNAVSGVVGLVSVAWDATAAAAEYLANAAGVLLTDLGITALVDQAVAALKTVASAMEAALQALMTYLISLAKAFISALIGTLGASFHNEISSWASSWKTTTGYIDGYYLGNQTDKSTAETQIWNDIGNLLVVMLGLAAVLAIVTTVTAPLDIGADVVGTLVLGVLATAFSLGAFGGYIGLPHSLLGDVAGSDFSYYSWVSELFFNLTQSPLNSSAALAIAVPDGDPFVAVAALFSALGLLVGMFAGVELVALASVRGNPSGGLAATFMAAELTFAGVGIAIASATDELTLPSSCSTSAERTAYQGDSNLAAVALGFATVSLLLLLLAIRLKVTTTLTLVSLAITAGVAVFSLASIVYVWHKCGTLP